MGPKPANEVHYIQPDDILIDHEVHHAHEELNDGKFNGILMHVAPKDWGGGRGTYRTVQVEETFTVDDLDAALEKLKDYEARYLVVKTADTKDKVVCAVWLGKDAGFEERAMVLGAQKPLHKSCGRAYQKYIDRGDKERIKRYLTG